MKTKGSKCITWTQRLQLETMVKTNVHKKTMAEILGVSLQTIYNELKRGTYTRLDSRTYEYVETYSPDITQARYEFYLTDKGPDVKSAEIIFIPPLTNGSALAIIHKLSCCSKNMGV